MSNAWANHEVDLMKGNENISSKNLLLSMQKSYASNNFELVIAKSFSGQLEPMSYYHGIINNNVYSYWLYLNGVPSGFFTKDKKVVYYIAGQIPYIVENGRAPFVLSRFENINIDDLFQHYNISILGKVRLADRSVISVELSSKNPDRYSYILGIDDDSDILLQVDVLDQSEKKIVETYAAMELKILQKPSPILENIHKFEIENSNINADELGNNEPFAWTLGYIPDGFKNIFSKKYSMEGFSEKVEHVMYSDGLSDFSVYKVNAISNIDFPIVKQGAVNLYRKSYNLYEIIVVGEIPLSVAVKIAESYKNI